jgi:hypothetical protein
MRNLARCATVHDRPESAFAITGIRNRDGVIPLDVKVTYKSHCFTEEFDQDVHQDQHRYSFQNELRAFDFMRYQCSLQLPVVMTAMFKGSIYRSDKNYTYIAQITPNATTGALPYSLVFSLNPGRSKSSGVPRLDLLVRSAYPAALKNRTSQHWRFVALAGQISGAWSKK